VITAVEIIGALLLAVIVPVVYGAILFGITLLTIYGIGLLADGFKRIISQVSDIDD